jgi:hypothetical protein
VVLCQSFQTLRPFAAIGRPTGRSGDAAGAWVWRARGPGLAGGVLVCWKSVCMGIQWSLSANFAWALTDDSMVSTMCRFSSVAGLAGVAIFAV